MSEVCLAKTLGFGSERHIVTFAGKIEIVEIVYDTARDLCSGRRMHGGDVIHDPWRAGNVAR